LGWKEGWEGGLGRRGRVGNGRGEKGGQGRLRERGKWIGEGRKGRRKEESRSVKNNFMAD